MKSLLLLVAALIPALASAAEECPVQAEKVSCLVTYNDGRGPQNQEVNFSLRSDTFLCDGRSNEYVEKQVVVGKKFSVWIYAGWESLSLGIYDKADKERMKEYAHSQSPRIKLAEKEIHSFQSISANLPGGKYAQVMCEPVEE